MSEFDEIRRGQGGLAEHEITHLIKILAEMGQRMQLGAAGHPEIADPRMCCPNASWTACKIATENSRPAKGDPRRRRRDGQPCDVENSTKRSLRRHT